MSRYIDEKDIYKLVEPTGVARVHCSQIDELPRADVVPKSEWISVDERLPEDTLPSDYKHKTIKVLVAIKAKNGVSIRTQQRFLDYTYKDGKRTTYWTWRFSAGKVTHWMPLPEAPKMKGGAE